jgi:hypothetical protein
VLSLKQRLLAAWPARATPDAQTLWRVGALLVVLITEAFGRQSESPAVDLRWSACLYIALLAMAAQWGALPAGLWARFRERWAFSTGVELRRQPGLTDTLPEVVWRTSLSVSVALAGTAAVHALLPGQLREIGLLVSPTLYFAYLGGVCLALCGLIVAGLSVVHFALARVSAEQLKARLWVGLGSLVAHVGWIVFAVVVLPVWLPFMGLAVGLAASAALIFLGPTWELSLLWRPRAGSRGPGRFSAARLAWHSAWWITAGVAGLALQLVGEHLWVAHPQLGITGVLGLGGAWVGVAFLMLTVYGEGRIHFLRRYRNPAQAMPVRLVLLGDPDVQFGPLLGPLASAGFLLEFGEQRCSSVSVPVRVGAGPRNARERWALAADAAQLTDPRFHERLRRRSSIRRRRQFLHGLHHLWKRAGTLSEAEATGFWLAPHLWYVPLLSADSGGSEDDARGDGIPYHPRIPLEARAEARAVLRGAEIDLLFIERGIESRSLRRVFLALFEYHDLFGGERRAEERHFVGIPGIRVLIDVHELGKSAAGAAPREPDYSSLGSARILHLFRDDGGDEADRPSPRDFQGVPLARGGSPLMHV